MNDSTSYAVYTSAMNISGTVYRGYLSSTANGAADYQGSDRDFYRYTYLSAGAQQYIRLDCFTNGSDGRSYHMRLYDEMGVLQGTYTDGMIYNIYTGPGNAYYVEVIGQNGPPGPYRLSFIRDTIPTPTPTMTPFTP